ncbi:hypothetical protein CEXT_749921 [Caerostris extrusa]|uniref:Uncharacterized protein n=1 Tax=Caerostris extrusa TaxID=172846 RepID=A0AAV4RVR5_CAEEX|nr:hypothetical protein CEXT_749921 [Caerostris extrusa]
MIFGSNRKSFQVQPRSRPHQPRMIFQAGPHAYGSCWAATDSCVECILGYGHFYNKMRALCQMLRKQGRTQKQNFHNGHAQHSNADKDALRSVSSAERPTRRPCPRVAWKATFQLTALGESSGIPNHYKQTIGQLGAYPKMRISLERRPRILLVQNFNLSINLNS